MGGFIIHRSLSVSSVERSGYAFMLPLQRASNAFAFPACSFSLASALPEATHVLPKHAMRLLRRTQPCGTAALPPRPLRRALLHTRSHTTLTPALRPSRAQRIPSCAGVRARRLTPLVSSCVEPPQPFWPLPRPYCTTSHAMIVCTSWLHSALRTTRVPLAPRFTATPTAARTH